MSGAEGGAHLPVLGAVLIGGRSRRFGSPKDAAEVGGSTLGERAVQTLSAVCSVTVVVDRKGGQGGPVRHGAPTLFDRVPDQGPLGGVHAALVEARRRNLEGAFVLACDLPGVSPAVVRDILSRRSLAPVVAPREGPHGVNPLCAWWSLDALRVVEAALAGEERALHRVAGSAGVHALEVTSLAGVGPETFLNVNTPGDAERADGISVEPSAR